tara:strand:- start:339 stop:1364 length:1026 start_codon:yes stop_codon:yes gene_type:complete
MPKIYLIVLSLFFYSCSSNNNIYEINGFTMGTTYSIKIVATTADVVKIKSNINNMLNSINMDMSTYIDSSSISRFNNLKSSSKFSISEDFYNVLKSSRYFFEITDGAFDPTVNPLVQIWGFSKDSLKELPTQLHIDNTLEMIGMDNLVMHDNYSISKNNSFATIDLSAIAKGYAVDKISEYLSSLKYNNHMIEIGGEVRVSGFNLDNSKWRIAIEYPGFQRSFKKTPYVDKDSENVHTILHISDMSIATSGDYRNYYDINGKRYSHIISPVTGYPIENKIVSVSVLTKECLNADALATALMVMDIQDGLALVEKLDGYESFYILDDNTNRFTTGFKDYLSH